MPVVARQKRRAGMYCPNLECPDAKESGTAGEYSDGVTVCPRCGSRLVPTRPIWTPAVTPESPDPERWVPCFTVGDVSLLPLIKATLRAAEVPHFVRHEGVQHWIGWGTAVFGFNPITGPPVVMVADSHLERARTLLAPFSRFEQGPDPAPAGVPTGPTRQPATCEHCRHPLETEDGEPPLTHCYHCGWPLRSA
jgi:hypothetical protein